MSDTSQGPGWWQASDGKWYSPEQVPAGSPPADTGYASSPQPQGYPSQPGWGDQGGYPTPQPGYGQPPAYGQPGGFAYPQAQQFSNGIGTAGMILGIIALVLFWFAGLSWILALLAVIFGGIGISKVNKREANNKGMAVAGLVCGSLVIAFWVVVFIIAAAS